MVAHPRAVVLIYGSGSPLLVTNWASKLHTNVDGIAVKLSWTDCYDEWLSAFAIEKAFPRLLKKSWAPICRKFRCQNRIIVRLSLRWIEYSC